MGYGNIPYSPCRGIGICFNQRTSQKRKETTHEPQGQRAERLLKLFMKSSQIVTWTSNNYPVTNALVIKLIDIESLIGYK